jgi:hypothetical protein
MLWLFICRLAVSHPYLMLGVPIRSLGPMDLNKELQDGLRNSLFSRSFANLSYLNSHYVVHMHKISSFLVCIPKLIMRMEKHVGMHIAHVRNKDYQRRS